MDALRAHGGRHLIAAAAGVAVLISGPIALGRLSGAAADEGIAVPARLAAAELAGEIAAAVLVAAGQRVAHAAPGFQG